MTEVLWRSAREAGVLLLAALVPAALAIAMHPQLADRARAGLETHEVRLVEVRGWTDEVLWVDARNEAEYAASSIPGAVHLEMERFEDDFAEVLMRWQPGVRIVVYCSTLSCATSREVATRLRDAGMDEVFYLHGGWEAWVDALKP